MVRLFLCICISFRGPLPPKRISFSMHIFRFSFCMVRSFFFKWRTYAFKASVSVVTVLLPSDVSLYFIFSKVFASSGSHRHWPSFYLSVFSLSERHLIDIIWYITFGALVHLTICLIFTHVFLGLDSLFLFLLEQYTIVKILSQFVMHLPRKDILASSTFWQLSVKVL